MFETSLQPIGSTLSTYSGWQIPNICPFLCVKGKYPLNELPNIFSIVRFKEKKKEILSTLHVIQIIAEQIREDSFLFHSILQLKNV